MGFRANMPVCPSPHVLGKGPIKKVATASGVLRITFRVVDVTTKHALV
jgi:hypothetical protein